MLLLGLIAIVFMTLTTVCFTLTGVLTARCFGVRVEQIEIGIGPVLTRHEGWRWPVELRAVPLGGSAVMAHALDPQRKPKAGTIESVRPWKQALIYASGPLLQVAVGALCLGAAVLAGLQQIEAGPLPQSSVHPTAVGGLVLAPRPATADGQLQLFGDVAGGWAWSVVSFQDAGGRGGQIGWLLTVAATLRSGNGGAALALVGLFQLTFGVMCLTPLFNSALYVVKLDVRTASFVQAMLFLPTVILICRVYWLDACWLWGQL